MSTSLPPLTHSRLPLLSSPQPNPFSTPAWGANAFGDEGSDVGRLRHREAALLRTQRRDPFSGLLTLQEAYYGEQMGATLDDILLQVHVVGGGVIGQSAFTKNHQWMFPNSCHQWKNSLESVGSRQVCQTIVVISVEPFGVVQFGSTRKIPETKESVDQVKESFRGMGEGQSTIISENETSSSDSKIFGTSRPFTSLASNGSSSIHDIQHGAEYANLADASHSCEFPWTPSSADSNLIFVYVFLLYLFASSV